MGNNGPHGPSAARLEDNSLRGETIVKPGDSTSGERHAYRLLNELEITYQIEKWFNGKSRSVRVDCYIPDSKICIEVDGTIHRKTDQKTKDADKNKILIDEFNCKVIRIRNSEICNWIAQDMDYEIIKANAADKPGLYRRAY